MSELEEIRTFVQLVDSGSATRAAEVRGVAVSGISRRMKELESRLGVKLLKRTTRSMQLTGEGQIFYERCLGILTALDEAEAEVTQLQQSLKGVLRIAAPLSFGVSHLSPALSEFMKEYPEIRVELDLNDKRVNLIEDGFDLAIRIGVLEDSTLRARKLVDVRYVICGAPSFFKTHGYPKRPSDLENLPGLFYSNIPNPSVWKFVSPSGRSGKVNLTNRFTSSNGDSLREAAISGLGVVCEPSFIVQSAIEAGSLQPILTEYQWFEASIYAVYPESRFLSLKSRRFIEFLSTRFSNDPNWESFLPSTA